ncbi:MAG: PepSY domain-containing protein [Deltaproteobacteria bacterium]|nr:PepSY domain-containing protein [Deltaproteobacteria bacterium]
MKKKTSILTVVVACAILIFSSATSHAASKDSSVTLGEATEIATEKVPGEVLKVERERGLFEVKIRTKDGSVKKVYVDAKDGSIVKSKSITLTEATDIATKEVPGEVLKVEYEKGHFEVKIRTTEGEVKEVYVDARSGEIVKVKSKSYDRKYDHYDDDRDYDRDHDRNRDHDRYDDDDDRR